MSELIQRLSGKKILRAAAIGLSLLALASCATVVGSIRSGDTAAASTLIGKASPAALSTAESGVLPLNEAVRQGNLKLVGLLLERGADPTKVEPMSGKKAGLSAFDVAYAKSDLEALKQMAAKNGKDNARLLAKAAKEGRADIATALVSLGADPLLPYAGTGADSGKSPLFLAIEAGSSEAALAMLGGLKEGALAKAEGKNAILLHVEARAGEVEVIKRLLELKADINGLSSDGSTPLIIAAAAGKDEAVNALIDLGADIVKSNKAGYNALIYSCMTNSGIGLATVRRILEKGEYEPLAPAKSDLEKAVNGTVRIVTDINLVANDGYSALAYAVTRGDVPLCKLLIDKGADVNQVIGEKHAILSLAVIAMKPEVCDLLIGEGADPKRMSPEGANLLFLLVGSASDLYAHGKAYDRVDFEKTFALLAGKGVDVNQPSGTKLTMIQYACMVMDIKLIKFLIANKAKITLDYTGVVPFRSLIGVAHLNAQGKLPASLVADEAAIYDIYVAESRKL